MKKLNKRQQDLIEFISATAEKAKEDLAIGYFRSIFKKFTRQKEAKQADGYDPGNFVLELKGKTSDWYAGFFQGLAYGRELDFAKVVVIANDFLALWYLSDIDDALINAAQTEEGAPNAIGKKLAKKFKNKKSEVIASSAFNLDAFYLPSKETLFSSDPTFIFQSLESFETHLKTKTKQRLRVTPKNFTSILKAMTPFFDQDNPLSPVRAFYSILFGWNEFSKVQISMKKQDTASVAGESVTGLIPDKREEFKRFIEERHIPRDGTAPLDHFFSLFDRALDAVAPDFRIKHGIYFTDLNLSRFAMCFVKRELGEIGDNYMVIDPACGSGNLATNWRSPLELRHKVVSEIEPELLFAVERRMLGDEWHNGKFTVIPKVSESKGLNFLDKSAEEYLDILKKYLSEKGLKPDKPIAFLCNPPYRNDEDQSAESIKYEIHPSIIDITGNDGASERYCCFLAQMQRICEQAESSGLPGESILLLFTKAAWLTDRPVFKQTRNSIFSRFESKGAFIVNGKEFFDLKGKFPVAFSIWKFSNKKLDGHRPIQITDLTWLKNKDLSEIDWDNQDKYSATCEKILTDKRSIEISFGAMRDNIKQWSGFTTKDFKRDRRKAEKGVDIAGGLPSKDRRHTNKKTYGESDGKFVGFMDDLTPCRIKYDTFDKPWFRLNNQFMDCRRTRCFSGPPDNRGFFATDIEAAKKLFTWFALGRTFASEGYPMWVDAMEMWGIELIPEITKIAFAVGLAENECVETVFPANNPIEGSVEIFVNNPMSPISTASFWSKEMKDVFKNGNSMADKLVARVNEFYDCWKTHLNERKRLKVTYDTQYFIGNVGILTANSGIVQIRDYAKVNNLASILSSNDSMQKVLGDLKREFYSLLADEKKIGYFTVKKRKQKASKTDINIYKKEKPQLTRFQWTLERRLALASYAVNELQDDPNFGRTKLTKVMYLAENISGVDLQTNYYREAAGPLDQRALYNKKIGIESNAEQRQLFSAMQPSKTKVKKGIVKYIPGSNINSSIDFFMEHFGDLNQRKSIERLINVVRPMTTDQIEIFATLFACWNDFLIKKKRPNDKQIINEFLTNWHESKKRFSVEQLQKALDWMKKNDLVPTGSGSPSQTKIDF